MVLYVKFGSNNICIFIKNVSIRLMGFPVFGLMQFVCQTQKSIITFLEMLFFVCHVKKKPWRIQIRCFTSSTISKRYLIQICNETGGTLYLPFTFK